MLAGSVFCRVGCVTLTATLAGVAVGCDIGVEVESVVVADDMVDGCYHKYETQVE